MRAAPMAACALAALAAVGQSCATRARGPLLIERAPAAERLELQPGHAIRWLQDGATFEALAQAIDGAKRSVHLEVQRWVPGAAAGRVLAALAAAHRRSLPCRVLLDDQESAALDDAPLRAAGCLVRRGDFALHGHQRGLLLVDGREAIFGSFALDDEWLGQGRAEDQRRHRSVHLRGPALRALHAEAAARWQRAAGPPFGPEDVADGAPVPGASARAGLAWGAEALLRGARQRLWVESPLLLFDPPLLDLLGQKAAQGADVRVLTAGARSEQRALLAEERERLLLPLAHGARIFEYAPAPLEVDALLVDQTLFALGPPDLPLLVVDDAPAAAQLAQMIEQDLSLSLQLRPRGSAGP